MIPGIDIKQMQRLMNQMGIKQEEVNAIKVIIEKDDGNRIIIEDPSVQRIVMQGQESWQITGKVREEQITKEGINEEDISIIMEKTGRSREDAKKALEETQGDIAEAIINLSNNENP